MVATHQLFDEIYTSEAIRVILTPIRTPVANAYAERSVATVRRECLDWLLLGSEHHLRRALVDYLEHYHAERPHRALGLRPPDPPTRPAAGTVGRRDRFGGLIHEYHRATA